MSDVTMHVNMTPLTNWRSTANKDFANRKRVDCWKKWL